jgi:hypothetical protein
MFSSNTVTQRTICESYETKRRAILTKKRRGESAGGQVVATTAPAPLFQGLAEAVDRIATIVARPRAKTMRRRQPDRCGTGQRHPPHEVHPMRAALLSITFAIGLSLAAGASAQTAPTVTATCKDGTTFSGTTRKGACHGHKGVATWGTQDATTPAAAAPAAAASPPASTPPASKAPATTMATNSSGTPAAKPGAPG